MGSLLYAADGEHVKKNFLRHFRNDIFEDIRIDDLKYNVYHPKIERLARSRRQILFFSPDFLKCLKWNFYKARKFVDKLNPLITVALFCCGLQEREVLDNISVFLPFYAYWPKFRVIQSGQNSIFPPSLMNFIILELNTYFPNEMTVVPDFVQVKFSLYSRIHYILIEMKF